MMPILASLAVLAAAGFLPALAVTRSAVYAAPLGPIVGALVLWAAAQLDFLTSLGWTATAVPTVAVVNLAAAAAIWADREQAWSEIRHRTAGWDTGLVALVASLGPWTMVRRSPVDWDARSIWFFQAEWIAEGGSDGAAALTNPAFIFSHPDYPKLGPAAIAAVWRTFDSRSVEVAQATTSVVVVSAVVAIGVTVGVGLRHVTAVTPRARWVVVAAVGLLSLAFHGAARSWSFNGYMDGLWAALIIGGFAATLGCASSQTFAAGIVLTSAAAATKNEALIPVLVLGVLVAVRYRTDRRKVVAAFAPVGVVAVWQVIRRILDVPSTYGNDQFRRIVSTVSLDELVDIGQSLAVFVAAPALAFAAIAIIGGRELRERRAELGMGSMALPAMIAGASLVALVAALVIVDPSRFRPIAERTTIAAVGLLLFDVCLSLVAALVDRPSPHSGQADVRRDDAARPQLAH